MRDIKIICDKCGSRIPRASLTVIRWSKTSEKREPYDLCGDCRDDLMEHMGLLPPTLPGFDREPAAATSHPQERKAKNPGKDDHDNN